MKIKFLNILFVIFVLFSPCVVFAADTDLDFTDSVANESGTGYLWKHDDKELILSGVSLDSGIILPSDSKITVKDNSNNSIITDKSSSITTSGDLIINGNGSLSLENPVVSGSGYQVFTGVKNLVIEDINFKSSGLVGISAESVNIKNVKLDVYGYRYGIRAIAVDKSNYVKLSNCTGNIVGELIQGIDVYNNVSGDAELLIENCSNLKFSGNLTNKKFDGSFNRSGVRVFVGSAGGNAIVTIKDSEKVEFYGTNTGIAATCNSTSNTASKAKLIIDNSSVISETVTSTWAAFFVNNNGTSNDSSSEIFISNSDVKAFAPNDVAIMTSTKNAPSIVNINNSTVEMSGVYAGIRAKTNTTDDADIIVTDSSLVVVLDKIGSNYNALDEMDKGVSSNGVSGVDDNSKIISPKDCILNINDNGTWDVPDNGTVIINDKEVTFDNGALIEPSGKVSPYIVKLNGKKYIDIDSALLDANDNDTVDVLNSNNIDDVILPVGVIITSPESLEIKTVEEGYKVVEEYNNGLFVYSAVELDKFSVNLFENDRKSSTMQIYENTELLLNSDTFNINKNYKIKYFMINGKKYNVGDKYLINNNEDIYIYYNVNNPNTYDDVLLSICLVIISIGFVIVNGFLLKKEV